MQSCVPHPSRPSYVFRLQIKVDADPIPKSRPTPSNHFVHRRRSIWEEFRKRTMEDREEMTSPLLNCVRQVRSLPVIIENVVLFWTVYRLLVLEIVGVGKKPPCPRVHRMLKCLSKFNQINVGLGATYTLTAFCAFRTIAVIRSESGKNLVFIVIIGRFRFFCWPKGITKSLIRRGGN